MIIKGLGQIKPTPVYDSYWRFAAERQEAFFQRLGGGPPPFSSDPVIASYHFTNCYRVLDRVTQYLIRHVIGTEIRSAEDTFFRIVLFKIFNKIDTWELLQRRLGEIVADDFDYAAYDRILMRAKARGARIYSPAYIMPTRAGNLGSRLKHRNHLRLLEMMLGDELPARLASARSMKETFEELNRFPMMGPFLSFQFVIDLNYSGLIDFSEMDFVVPGPGARDGIRKCFIDYGGLNEVEIIRWVTERQVEEFARLGLDFRWLAGRKLQLIDCQNLFCEIDKYSRVAHPEFMGWSGRSRIKRRYRPRAEGLEILLPAKWGLKFSGEEGS